MTVVPDLKDEIGRLRAVEAYVRESVDEIQGLAASLDVVWVRLEAWLNSLPSCRDVYVPTASEGNPTMPGDPDYLRIRRSSGGWKVFFGTAAKGISAAEKDPRPSGTERTWDEVAKVAVRARMLRNIPELVEQLTVAFKGERARICAEHSTVRMMLSDEGFRFLLDGDP